MIIVIIIIMIMNISLPTAMNPSGRPQCESSEVSKIVIREKFISAGRWKLRMPKKEKRKRKILSSFGQQT